MKKSSTLAVLLFMTFALFAQGKGEPVIDMHQHARFTVYLNEKGDPIPRMCFPDPCESAPAQAINDGDILKVALAQMEKYNVVLAVVSDPDLDDVFRWQQSAPDKFIAGAGFFSIGQADSLRIRRELEAGTIQVMGEVGVQYDGMALNDPALMPYYSLAEEFDVPVLIHCAGLGGGNPRFNLSAGNPLVLQEVLDRHPTLRIYIENASWPFLEEITALLYRYPRVYVDLSTITWLPPEETFYAFLKGLIANGLGKRIMFGSDQMEWPEAIGIGIERISNADFLSKGQKRDILYNNAARFLRLPEETIRAHHK